MAAAAEELDVDGIAVRLSNPDKVYFPKLGSKGTKRRLVEYYLAVSGGPMLSSLRDRPTHLQRFPDGIDGEEIYQKRVPQHHPDYLETCRVTFPSGRTADALKVTNPAAIVWAAPGQTRISPTTGRSTLIRLAGGCSRGRTTHPCISQHELDRRQRQHASRCRRCTLRC
jgi:hypothetical protein